MAHNGLRIQWDRPRKGYDQHGRHWLEQEPYLSPYQLLWTGEEINPDLEPFTDLRMPAAYLFHDSPPEPIRSNHAELGDLTSKRTPRIKRNPHRDRIRRERKFHHGTSAPGGRGRRSDGRSRPPS